MGTFKFDKKYAKIDIISDLQKNNNLKINDYNVVLNILNISKFTDEYLF